jgi:hypothetical protein
MEEVCNFDVLYPRKSCDHCDIQYYVNRRTTLVCLVSRNCYMFVTVSLLLSSVPRISSREQPMLYASSHQHLPISNDDEENRVPLLDAEHS